MAKQTLHIGGRDVDIDLLSRDDLAAELDRFHATWRGLPERKRIPSGLLLDTSGNTSVGGTLTPVKVYTVEVGFILRLHRIVFELAGYTLGSPYTKSGGYYEICREGRYVDGQPLSSPGFPQVWTAGTADGIEYRSGEDVQILVSTGDAGISGAALRVELEGTLNPLEYTAKG